MMLDEIIEKIWKENWNIIRVSKAYKEGYPLKLAKPMIEFLFKSAMKEFFKTIEKDGDYVLVPSEVAEKLVWSHVWRVECMDCKTAADYDAVGFLHYLKNGKKCDACGSSNTRWWLIIDGSNATSSSKRPSFRNHGEHKEFRW